jgi:hypothetical protein
MGGQRLSKSKREGLVAGTVQPQNPKERSYLANQLARREAGGRLPVTREQIEHDSHHAHMRRTAQAHRAEGPRNSSFHGESSRRSPDHTDRNHSRYRPHGRVRSPSSPGPLVFQRDDFRSRMPERTTFDREPEHDSRDADWNRQDPNQERSAAGHLYGSRGNSYPERVIYERVTYEYRDSGYDRPPPPPSQRPEARPALYRPDTYRPHTRDERRYRSRSPPRGRRVESGRMQDGPDEYKNDRFDRFQGRGI